MEIPYGVIAAALGFGAILLFLVKHYVTRDSNKRDKRDARHDANDAIHASNQGKQIDADTEAFKIIAARLHEVEERLEKKIDKLQDELSSQREMNARKDAKIEHLEADNIRLRERCNQQRDEIAALRAELEALKRVVQLNGPSRMVDIHNTDPLRVTLVDEEAS